MRSWKGSWGLVAIAAAVVSACSGAPEDPLPDSDKTCIPNQQVECSCPSGELGIKACLADGTGFGSCEGCDGSLGVGCSSAPDCGSCTSCFDTCVCQGQSASACLEQCTTSTGGATGSGGGGSGGYGAYGGSGGGSAGTGATGGYSGGGGGGGVMDCQGCLSSACGSQLSSCSSTSGCLDLVSCAGSSGCFLDDYACLAFSCGVYMLNFGAIQPAISLGSCAAQACGAECS
jgi:hypothetical protein